MAEQLLSLIDIHDGLLVEEFDEELHRVVQQIEAHGGVGSVTLKVTVKPESEGGTLYGLKYQLAVAMPKVERKNLYELGDGGLKAGTLLPVRKPQDERQLTLADARMAINRLEHPNDHTPPEAYNIVNMPKKDTANG